jgi:RNA polymerase sigma-70 factor (ECF subfamily)
MGPDHEALAEQLLVLRAQMGSRDAYAELVQRYDARLLFYLRRLLGRVADAEDVRQDVWLTVVRKLKTLEDPAAFRAWLYRIARHRGISWLRRRHLEVPLHEAGAVEEPAVESEIDETSGFSPEEASAVLAALDTLSPRHREILALRFLGQLTYDEIACVLDCSIGTVRSRIHYAKAALRASLPGVVRPSGANTKKMDGIQ